jgi:YjbE family integral membrane protein
MGSVLRTGEEGERFRAMSEFDFTLGEHFWTALGQIILVNIILSGDNAVVIALACRNLSDRHKKPAILAGSLGAIILRLIFSFFIVYLMSIPYLKIIGAVLLLWIGVKLLLPEDEDHGDGKSASSNLWGAVRTIVIADAVMSLDNVIAIAAAAKGHILLIAIGLIISIPLIIFGSTLVLKVLLRFPVLVTLGGGLLGWIAGEISLTDPAIHAWAETLPPWSEKAAAAVGAIFVMGLGKILARRMEQKRALVDLAESGEHK